jgi:hypothetical protein
VPEGPSEETAGRILSALQAAGAVSRARLSAKRNTTRWLARIAAAALLAAGLFYALEPPLLQPALAFGEVAQKLRDARTLTYDMTLEIPGAKEPVLLHLHYKDPGFFRAEAASGQVFVTHMKVGISLVLDPKTKTAVLMTGTDCDPPAASAAQMVGRLRRLIENGGVPVGQKQIGTVQAQGFRAEERGQQLIVWADPKTKQILLVENTVRVGDLEGHVTLTHFEIDPVLDDSLFRLEPPKEYTLLKLNQEPLSPEEAVVRLLRLYAENAGGSFPARLDDWAGYDRVFQNKRFKSPTDVEYLQLTWVLGRIAGFVQEWKDRYGYQASGVKLGDAGKIIFWYSPKGAASYRVVYGDLRIGDVPPDRIPWKP